MILDLRDVDFDTWLRLIFDHHVPERRQTEEWYWQDHLEILVDPTRQLEFLARMCAESESLIQLFSPDQIDQGLWFIFGAGGEERFTRYLWESEIPWPVRQACILAFPKLWSGLFERASVGTMSYMLWDSLAFDYDSGPLNPHDDPEAQRVQDAMFRAMCEQLGSKVPETQFAALHGLGHLRHPSTPRELREYARRADVTEDNRSYAQAVMAGEGVL
jgi:hypothetical protein